MNTLQRKSGFTLIELLVCIAILGLIIVVAGKAFSDSTVMRVRSQNMARSAEVVGQVSNLLREDISQMGTKVWGEYVAGDYNVDVRPEVYWNHVEGDFSSYELHSNPVDEEEKVFFDRIVFKKAVFDEDGSFVATHEIAWEARFDSQQLWRSCVSSCTGASCDADDHCPESVLVAENLANFKLTPSIPGLPSNAAPDILFPPPGSANGNFALLSRATNTSEHVVEIAGINITQGGDKVVISSFSTNYNNNNPDDIFNQLYLAKGGENDWQKCERMDFSKGEIYAIEFKMPFFESGDIGKNDSNSTQFQPGMDHLAVGLRTHEGVKREEMPADILFYPPQSLDAANKKKHAEFSVSEDVTACVALTFAFYSPKANTGKLRFSDFRVFRKSEESFHFPKPGETAYGYGVGVATNDEERKRKMSVKAFELVMEIEHRGEKAGTYSNSGNGMAITTPNNGVIPLPLNP